MKKVNIEKAMQHDDVEFGRMSSNGQIVIPIRWRTKLDLFDCRLFMKLRGEQIIIEKMAK